MAFLRGVVYLCPVLGVMLIPTNRFCRLICSRSLMMRKGGMAIIIILTLSSPSDAFTGGAGLQQSEVTLLAMVIYGHLLTRDGRHTSIQRELLICKGSTVLLNPFTGG